MSIDNCNLFPDLSTRQLTVLILAIRNLEKIHNLCIWNTINFPLRIYFVFAIFMNCLMSNRRSWFGNFLAKAWKIQCKINCYKIFIKRTHQCSLSVNNMSIYIVWLSSIHFVVFFTVLVVNEGSTDISVVKTGGRKVAVLTTVLVSFGLF